MFIISSESIISRPVHFSALSTFTTLQAKLTLSCSPSLGEIYFKSFSFIITLIHVIFFMSKSQNFFTTQIPLLLYYFLIYFIIIFIFYY